jgi:hypothetical protein
MAKLIVAGFSISLDGFGAGPKQSKENGLGVGGEALHDWLVHTRTFKSMYGCHEGDTGIDDELASGAATGNGAWIMDRG